MVVWVLSQDDLLPTGFRRLPCIQMNLGNLPSLCYTSRLSADPHHVDNPPSIRRFTFSGVSLVFSWKPEPRSVTFILIEYVSCMQNRHEAWRLTSSSIGWANPNPRQPSSSRLKCIQSSQILDEQRSCENAAVKDDIQTETTIDCHEVWVSSDIGVRAQPPASRDF